jgi:hypothetical protein
MKSLNYRPLFLVFRGCIMKTPHQLADSIKRSWINGVVRETFRLPRSETRRRIQGLFKDFPSATHLTEIESIDELPGGFVELTIKRRADVDEP